MLVRMPPPAEAVRRSFEELSKCRSARCGAAIKLQRIQEVGSALDQEHRALAEQIRIDQTHIRAQSGHFKLPDADATILLGFSRSLR